MNVTLIKLRKLARMRRRAVVQHRGKLFRNLRRIVALINGELDS